MQLLVQNFTTRWQSLSKLNFEYSLTPGVQFLLNISTDPSEVGLIITYALSVTQVLNWLVRMTADVETNIVAVERIKEYSEMGNEANWTSSNSPPTDWPSSGSVTFSDYGKVRFKYCQQKFKDPLKICL